MSATSTTLMTTLPPIPVTFSAPIQTVNCAATVNTTANPFIAPAPKTDKEIFEYIAKRRKFKKINEPTLQELLECNEEQKKFIFNYIDKNLYGKWDLCESLKNTAKQNPNLLTPMFSSPAILNFMNSTDIVELVYFYQITFTKLKLKTKKEGWEKIAAIVKAAVMDSEMSAYRFLSSKTLVNTFISNPNEIITIIEKHQENSVFSRCCPLANKLKLLMVKGDLETFPHIQGVLSFNHLGLILDRYFNHCILQLQNRNTTACTSISIQPSFADFKENAESQNIISKSKTNVNYEVTPAELKELMMPWGRYLPFLVAQNYKDNRKDLVINLVALMKDINDEKPVNLYKIYETILPLWKNSGSNCISTVLIMDGIIKTAEVCHREKHNELNGFQEPKRRIVF